MIRIANSILFRNDASGSSSKEYTEWQLKDRFVIINYKRCIPPLPADEIDQIWKDALAYHAREKSKQQQQRQSSVSDVINNGGIITRNIY